MEGAEHFLEENKGVVDFVEAGSAVVDLVVDLVVVDLVEERAAADSEEDSVEDWVEVAMEEVETVGVVTVVEMVTVSCTLESK